MAKNTEQIAEKRRHNDASLNSGEMLVKTTSNIPLLDFFIPQNLHESSDDLYRGRILIGICLCSAISMLVFILLAAFVLNLDEQTKMGGFIFTIPMFVIFCVFLWGFKSTGAHNLIANLITGATAIAVTLGVYMSGGPIVSPATYVMPIPVLLSFCLSGRQWGLFWAIAVFFAQVIMLVMGFNGHEFINTVAPENAAVNEACDWAVAYFITIAIMVIYENMQFKLKQERDAQEQRFIFLATHDALTQLPNRILFYDRARMAISRSKRGGKPFALFYLDLNGFKPVNDKYGHEAGDHVLKIVGERVQSTLRGADIVARFGGDEFAVITEEVVEIDKAVDIAKKILAIIEEPIVYMGINLTISTSIGISFYPNNSFDIDGLLKQADEAMYEAKRSKQHIVRFDMLKKDDF